MTEGCWINEEPNEDKYGKVLREKNSLVNYIG